MPVDADTKRFLEEAKKGKPRKFAMMCKGVNILGLCVYKRGPVEKFKKELKKQGTGQFYSGVISGRGEQIVFELLRSECDKSPTKDLTLKEFLNAEAGMKFRPAYELVDELTSISDSGDDAGGEAKAGPPAPESPAEAPAEGPTPESIWKERAAGLAANLQELKRLNVDLAQHPNLTKFAKGAQEFAKRGDYDKAHKLMDEVDRLAAGALSEARKGEAAGAGAKGRVQKQVYLRERWKQVPVEVDARVSPLRPTIGDELATELKDALQALIDEIDEKIQDSVDAGARDFGAAVAAIRSAKQEVQANELIRHLEAHPSIPNLGVESSFVQALDDLESQLAS